MEMAAKGGVGFARKFMATCRVVGGFMVAYLWKGV